MSINSGYQDISDLLSQHRFDLSINQLRIDWDHWLNRFRFYQAVQSSKFLAWQQDAKKIWRQQLLYNALLAFDEFEAVKHRWSDAAAANLREFLICSIRMHLSKLEIDQLKRLESVQQLTRKQVIEEKRQRLLLDRKYIHHHFFKNQSEFLQSLDGNDLDTRYLYRMIKARSGKVRYGRILHKTEDTQNAFFIVHSIIDLINRIISNASLVQVLTYIPIVSIFLVSTQLVLGLFKSFSQKKGDADIFKYLAGLTIVGSALMAIALAPVASALIASILVSTVYLTQKFIPWIQVLSEQHKKVKRLDRMAGHYRQLIDDHCALVLTADDKKMLARELEDYSVNLPDEGDQSQLKSAIESIQQADDPQAVQQLEKHPLIKNMLVSRQLSIRGLLVRETKKEMSQISEDLSVLKHQEKQHRWKVITGFLGVVGAAMLCVPIPIILMVGAALLTFSTVIGVALKYDVLSKVTKYFRDGRGAEGEAAVVTPSSTRLINDRMPNRQNNAD